jgi:hypothetical protein
VNSILRGLTTDYASGPLIVGCILLVFGEVPVVATSSHQLRREPLGLFPNKSGHGPYYRIVELLRGRHYSGRPEEAYLHWIGRYIEFRGCRHPWQLAEGNVNRLMIMTPSPSVAAKDLS